MALNDKNRAFFTKLAKIWQNFNDYNFLKGIELSPEQISVIEHEEDQLMIEGYAGTGKSITLIYKFINTLIKETQRQRILYVTYNSTLIEDTKKRLISSEVYKTNKDNHEIEIKTFHQVASKLIKELKINNKGLSKLTGDKIKQAHDDQYRRIAAILARINEDTEIPKDEKLYKTHNAKFIMEEIIWMKANGIIKKEDYCNGDLVRRGRSKAIRLNVSQRNTIFKILEIYQHDMKNKYGHAMDLEDYALVLLENLDFIASEFKYDYIFVDEMQDLDPMQVKLLCNLTKKSIVFSGDAKQRIYKKTPINYEQLGLRINEKGKRKILNKNYRSTAQIIKLANSLKFTETELQAKFDESLFVKQGEKPVIGAYKDSLTVIKEITKEINNIFAKDDHKNVAIIHREELKKTNGSKSDFRLKLEYELKLSISDISNYYRRFDHDGTKQIFYTNIYDVKGLEFDYVFIVDFNNAYYPPREEVRKMDESKEGGSNELLNQDIEDFKSEDKKRLYVAMTRAKEKLFLMGNGVERVSQFSEFIYDFNARDFEPVGFTDRDFEKYARIVKEAEA